MTTDQPTIADVWAAFVALSAAWDAKYPNDWALQLHMAANGAGEITRLNSNPVVEMWDTLADALTAIAEARAGLEG